jgi:hypothetical protein
MPRTRQPKRSNSASSVWSEKRVKKVNKLPTGENKADLTPAIRFCDAVKDVDDKSDVKYVTIKVKINQDKADSRVNLEDKKFLEIADLTYIGAKVDFTMPEFSASKIITQRFYVDNEEEDMNIGYDMVAAGAEELDKPQQKKLLSLLKN